MKRLVKARKNPRAASPAKTGALLQPRNVDSNRQALESCRFEDSQPTLTKRLTEPNPTDGINQPCPGRPGKPPKSQSRPRVYSNRPTSGTFLKRAGHAELLQPNQSPKRPSLKAKNLKTMCRHHALGKTLKVPVILEKSRRFALPNDLYQREACPRYRQLF